ncbi:DUF1327 domain-containing protein [Escherichia coli]|nr:DUF1327 domain-containing protein [Escherichia coli]
MNKKYELVVKGINHYPDKITVTVALVIAGQPSLLSPYVAISLDRTEGATLEFYEAEAKKQAKQFFMDAALGLREGTARYGFQNISSWTMPEKIATYPGREKVNEPVKNAPDDVQSAMVNVELPARVTPGVKVGEDSRLVLTKRIGSVVSVHIDHEEVLSVMYREDYDPKTTFSDYEARAKEYALSVFAAVRGEDCRKNGHESDFTVPVSDKNQERECNRLSFVVSGDDGKITISENGKVTPPSHQHCEMLIEFAIDYLKNNKKQGLMKRIGRCMGYLQVAAEIEALASGADKDAVVRETVLRDFNTPPFKTEPDNWIQPGLTYLKVRI